jgi:methyltransferase (TIGR00027 family)
MNDISATARLIAMYRALESDRPDALFRDPFARRLAGGEGAMMVEVIGQQQQGTSAIAIRTTVIDQMILHLIQSERIDTVLNLAAGLDSRPYRFALPASLRWIEVDLPKIVRYKEQILNGEQPACKLERIELDLMDIDLRKQLFEQINASSERVIVMTEGLLSYLNEAQVTSLANDLHHQSHFCHWVFELAAPLILRQAQNSDRQKLFDQYFANGAATFLFAPKQGTEFFRSSGWTVKEFRSLWKEACRLKRQSDLVQWGGLPMRWFAKQTWQAITQQTGFVLLERLVGAPQ